MQENPRLAKHPSSGLSLDLPTATNRGKRLIVVNAIDRSGPVPNALWIFPSRSPTTPEDYHKDMDSFNFEKWFQERLLPNIPPDSVIVMDNAPYHSRKEGSLPSNLRRAEVINRLTDMGFFNFLSNKGVQNDPTKMTRKKLFALWKEHRSHFEKYAVDELATSSGRTVLRLPPYHRLFNPIELLWAHQKRIARSQSTR